MFSLIKRYRNNECGASAVEYAMLVVFVALALATGATARGSGLNTWFQNVGGAIAGLNSTIPSGGDSDSLGVACRGGRQWHYLPTCHPGDLG